MDEEFFSMTQRHAAALIAFAEDIGSTLDRDGSAVAATGAAAETWDDPVVALFRASGRLEGLRLKGQGFLSADLLEYIQDLAMTFEMEVNPAGPFKLPFIGQSLMVQRKTLNALRETAWEAYHEALLSAYALRSLSFTREQATPGDAFDVLLTVKESHPALPFPDRRRESQVLEKKLDALANQLAAAQEACSQTSLKPRLTALSQIAGELRTLLGL